MSIYTVTFLITFFVVLITAADVSVSRLISEKDRHKILVVCITIFIAALCEYIGKKTDGASPAFIGLHRTAKLIEFCTSPCIGIAAANAYGKMKKKLMAGLLIAHALFEFSFLLSKYVFWIDENNIYHRENLYWVYIAVFVISIFYCYACIISGNKRFRAKLGFSTILIFIFLFVGIVIQMIYSDMTVDFMCVSIGSFFLYHYYGNIKNQVDVTTKLLNRRCFTKRIENLKPSACILFFDADHFKSINDTFGHADGGMCLADVANIMLSVYGKFGQCYRIGGDEFCIILCKNFDKLEALNNEFSDSVNELCKTYGDIFGVSIGYALYDNAKTDINSVIKRADDIMYENKRQKQFLK